MTQQMKSVEEIEGIDLDDVIELTGSTSLTERAEKYSKKRIFFQTPQTLQHDLERGVVDVMSVVLVIYGRLMIKQDEAHKASGEYAYCKISKILESNKAVYRSIALSATPGNNMKAIQSVISNLSISKVEARADSDPELTKFAKHREVDPLKVNASIAVELIDLRLTAVLELLLDKISSILCLDEERAVMPANIRFLNYDSVRAVSRSFKKNFAIYEQAMPGRFED